MTNVLQIALDKEGNLKSIYEVKTGIECECFCPECKTPLEAKNRNKTSNESLSKGQKIAHFAHSDGSVCLSAPETAIHLLAKKVLSETRNLLIPALYRDNIILRKEEPITFDKAEVEKEVKNDTFKIKPDIILTKNNKELFVEFYKTHQVDEQKVQKIKSFNISCIEIDINYVEPLVDGKLNTEELKNIFEKDSSYMTWIYNTQEETLYAKEKERLLKEEQEKKRLQELEVAQIATAQAEQKARKDAWKKGLLTKGYDFLKVYEYVHWDYQMYSNENTGHVRTYRRFDSKDENVYCPKQKENGKNKRIELNECKNCEHHNSIVYEEHFEKKIACGFRNNLTRK